MEGGWGSCAGVLLGSPLKRELALQDFRIVSAFSSSQGSSQAAPFCDWTRQGSRTYLFMPSSGFRSLGCFSLELPFSWLGLSGPCHGMRLCLQTRFPSPFPFTGVWSAVGRLSLPNSASLVAGLSQVLLTPSVRPASSQCLFPNGTGEWNCKTMLLAFSVGNQALNQTVV